MLSTALSGALLARQSPPKLPAGGKSTIRVPKLLPAPFNFLHAGRGWQVDLYYSGLRHPRMMAVAENGDLFVVETRLEIAEKNQPHDVVVLSQKGPSGKPTKKTLWSDKLNYPFGIQFGFGHIYVANTGSVVRWEYRMGQTSALGEPETVLGGIPDLGYRNHWTRNILFDPTKKWMYLTIGSKENLAEEGPRRAVIERYLVDADGKLRGPGETYSSGMRNPIGLATNPADGRLWANVAERDYEGDGLVPDYLTSVKRGGFYGWPYCFIGNHHDPRMPHKPELEKKALVPDVLFEAHSTPIDVKFIPEGAVVALHGSQNRSKLNGYKVVLVPFLKGEPSRKPTDLVWGWLPAGSNKEIYGRPAGIAVQSDGSILVCDDWGGKIWRIRRTAHGV